MKIDMKTDFKKQLSILVVAGVLMIIIDFLLAIMGNSVDISSDANGKYLYRPDKTGYLSLRVRTQNKGKHYDKEFDVTLSPYESDQNSGSKSDNNESTIASEELIEQEIRSIVMSLNDEKHIRKVYLPRTLSGGQELTWTVVRNTHTVLIAFMCFAVGLLLFRGRNAPLRRRKKLQRESITRQLPEFVNRLVLLLNAGLVLNTAFMKAIEEGLKFQQDEKDYFWSRMNDIYISVCETNSSPNSEFRNFARETGSNELIRISNILNDNISKGVELTEKLYCESELLWVNRKRDCEEHGRISEEKMVLPLTALLLVLVIITASPALLEL